MTTLYDMSVKSYLQGLTGVIGVLEKGHAHCQDCDEVDLAGVIETRLRPDMLPFRFQLMSVAHHSLGAVKGLESGEFAPPPPMPELDYAGWQSLIEGAKTELEAVESDAINQLAGKMVTFKLGDNGIPFTAENFVLSFSLPNFYFHAATAYDILRMHGTPLSKRDYMGPMRMGV